MSFYTLTYCRMNGRHGAERNKNVSWNVSELLSSNNSRKKRVVRNFGTVLKLSGENESVNVLLSKRPRRLLRSRRSRSGGWKTLGDRKASNQLLPRIRYVRPIRNSVTHLTRKLSEFDSTAG